MNTEAALEQYREELKGLRAYLTSPKFYTDSTGGASELLARIEELITRVEQALDDGGTVNRADE